MNYYISKVIGKLDSYKRHLLSKLYTVRYSFYNKFSSVSLSNSVNNQYIVSLTTYNKRLSKVFLTIESLFAQESNIGFDVHLYLCDDDVITPFPASLKRLEKRGLKIIRVDENIRSYKKLYYCYLNNKDKTIITVDDDVFYPHWWLDSLINHHLKHEMSVVAFRGHMIKFNSQGQVLPYSSFIGGFKFEDHGYLGLIPTGVSGVLYPVGSLYGLEFEKNLFLEYCSSADDLWFKFLTLRNGYDSRLVDSRNIHFVSLPDTQSHSLRLTNLDGNKNDIQLKNLADLYPEIFESLYDEFTKRMVRNE